MGSADFSPLLFVDDALMFYDALPAYLYHLQRLFLCFEVASGLKVNFAKPKLLLVGNVTQVGRLA